MDPNVSEYYKDYNRWKKKTKRNGKCYKWNSDTSSGWIEYFDKDGNHHETHVKERERTKLRVHRLDFLYYRVKKDHLQFMLN